MKKWWPLLLFVVGLSIVLLYQYQKYRVAPAVDVFTLNHYDTTANPVKFSSFKGKKMIYYFWATWCGECLAEMKELSLAKKHALKDVEVVMVTDQPLEVICPFIQR